MSVDVNKNSQRFRVGTSSTLFPHYSGKYFVKDRSHHKEDCSLESPIRNYHKLSEETQYNKSISRVKKRLQKFIENKSKVLAKDRVKVNDETIKTIKRPPQINALKIDRAQTEFKSRAQQQKSSRVGLETDFRNLGGIEVRKEILEEKIHEKKLLKSKELRASQNLNRLFKQGQGRFSGIHPQKPQINQPRSLKLNLNSQQKKQPKKLNSREEALYHMKQSLENPKRFRKESLKPLRYCTEITTLELGPNPQQVLSLLNNCKTFSLNRKQKKSKEEDNNSRNNSTSFSRKLKQLPPMTRSSEKQCNQTLEDGQRVEKVNTFLFSIKGVESGIIDWKGYKRRLLKKEQNSQRIEKENQTQENEIGFLQGWEWHNSFIQKYKNLEGFSLGAELQ